MKKYRYINTVWKYEFNELVGKLMLPFLSDYFEEDESDAKEDFLMELVLKTSDDINEILQYGDDILIHNSRKPLFYDKGMYLDKGYIRYVYNLITKSVYKVDRLFKKISVFNADIDMLCRDGIRVLRDFVKVNVENNDRAIMFHSSTVASEDGQCIMFIGDKAMGKTTLSLKLIYEYGFSEISRDRTYIKEINNELVAYGWPTYYNLTMKTIKHFKETRHLLPNKFEDIPNEILSGIRTKLQLTPEKMGLVNKGKMGKLSYIVYLLRKGETFDKKEILSKNCYSPNDSYSTDWHGLFINKNKILDDATYIADKFLEFPNTVFLEIDSDINVTIEKLLNAINGKCD